MENGDEEENSLIWAIFVKSICGETSSKYTFIFGWNSEVAIVVVFHGTKDKLHVNNTQRAGLEHNLRIDSMAWRFCEH